jgi:hypothetical protein
LNKVEVRKEQMERLSLIDEYIKVYNLLLMNMMTSLVLKGKPIKLEISDKKKFYRIGSSFLSDLTGMLFSAPQLYLLIRIGASLPAVRAIKALFLAY